MLATLMVVGYAVSSVARGYRHFPLRLCEVFRSFRTKQRHLIFGFRTKALLEPEI
jgi:hypothetical protein